MHYVKHFNINGIATKQVACIELQSKPNTATEGAVGLLGIDMSSPLHEIYKCVAVNGNIYTWELFSSGLSIVSATISGNGDESVQFPYDTLKTPLTYMVKPGDLIIDSNGYLYQIDSLGAIACNASYCGTQVVAFGKSSYDLAVQQGFTGTIDEWLLTLRGDPGPAPEVGINNHWWVNGKDTGVDVALKTVVTGSYIGTGTYGEDNPNTLVFERPVKMLIIMPPIAKGTYSYYAPSDDEEYSDGWGYDMTPDDKLEGDTHGVPLSLFGTEFRPIVNRSSSSDDHYIRVTEWGKTVSWYCKTTGSSLTAGDLQRNVLGCTYHYLAFLGEENGDGTDYIDTALDNIIAIQEELIGGGGE